MNIKFANNASTVLSSALDKDSNIVRISAGASIIFPILTEPDDYFRITVVHPGTGEWEIMKVTSVSGDVFTVERAQEGTIAINFPQNSLVENRLTAASLEEILNDVDASDTQAGRVRIATEEEVRDGRVNDACLTPFNSWYLKVMPGVIVAFSGTFDSQGFPIDVHTGKPRDDWHRCDGTYNTPDLQDKFIMCAGPNHPVNDSGGDVTHPITVEVKGHALTEAEMPMHNHEAGYKQIFNFGYQGDGCCAIVRDLKESLLTENAGGGKQHTHEATAKLPDEALPPYYAYSYIMKIK